MNQDRRRKERAPVPVDVYTYGSDPVTVDAAQLLAHFGKQVRIKRTFDPIAEEIVRRGEFLRPPDAADLALLYELANQHRTRR